MFDNIEPWARFACEVARELASPGAEDLISIVHESDLPDLAECLRDTLAGQSATIATLRSDGERLQAEAAQLRADRAVLLASAVVTYGAEVLPADREERRRARHVFLAQLPHQPGDPAVTELIREMFVRAAAEAPPEDAP